MQEKKQNKTTPVPKVSSAGENETNWWRKYTLFLLPLPLLFVALIGYFNHWFSSKPGDILLHLSIFLLFYGIIFYNQRLTGKKERRRVESEQKFELLLDSAPDATVIVDENGWINMVNRQVENLFGYTKEELLGQPVEILIPKDLRSRHIQHRGAFTKSPKIRSMGAGIELKAIKKDGNSFPVEISLSPIQTKEGLMVSASIRDITDRKKAEEKFRSLLDSAPDATVIVNKEGCIEMINLQVENLFGYTKTELLGQRVEILIPADLHQLHQQHRNNYIRSPKVRSMGAGLELNAVKKEGMTFPVEISLSPIHTEEGMFVAASVRDISVRKKLEGDLKKSHSDIEAFTYSVSHDLRAPLRGILGFANILEEDYADKLDKEGKNVISVIKNSTLRMGRLIDDLLAFSRMDKQAITKVIVDMKKLVGETINDFREREKEGIQWQLTALPPARADLNLIRQVWVNLLSNAVKYSANKPIPRIEIGYRHEREQLIYFVKDNGVGFDEKYKDKLFKVFQRLHNSDQFEGTGVGLALVERIISKHGGRIWADGKEDEGACFYFSLPV